MEALAYWGHLRPKKKSSNVVLEIAYGKDSSILLSPRYVLLCSILPENGEKGSFQKLIIDTFM
jgi:hypothetical protein